MPVYTDNYGTPTIQGIIEALLFEGFEFKTTKISPKELKPGDIFIFNRVYVLIVGKVTDPIHEDIYKFEGVLLDSHELKTISIENDDNIKIKRIDKCFKM